VVVVVFGLGYLTISRHISSRLATSRHISPYLATSHHISSYLAAPQAALLGGMDDEELRALAARAGVVTEGGLALTLALALPPEVGLS